MHSNRFCMLYTHGTEHPQFIEVKLYKRKQMANVNVTHLGAHMQKYQVTLRVQPLFVLPATARPGKERWLLGTTLQGQAHNVALLNMQC